jgi:hypothetical protein
LLAVAVGTEVAVAVGALVDVLVGPGVFGTRTAVEVGGAVAVKVAVGIAVGVAVGRGLLSLLPQAATEQAKSASAMNRGDPISICLPFVCMRRSGEG